MKTFLHDLYEIHSYLLLWFTQLISGLGSAMTSYALVIWSYTQAGSALQTALLMVCSYAPYVACSIFAGALSDRWDKKKTMLVCDGMAALSTVVVFALLKTELLQIWHLYVVNAVSGLMNTVQQPASEVATTALLPKRFYQKVGGLRYLQSSLSSILTPILATAVLGLWGMDVIIAIDLGSCLVACVILWLCIPIPKTETLQERSTTSVLTSAKEGIGWLKQNPGIFHLMLFLAAINLVASMYNAAFPAMMLTKASETTMGRVNTVIGVTMLVGSILASLMKTPKSRVRAIWGCLMLSMCTENFFLGFGDAISRNFADPLWLWCVGAALGWIAIPWMNANLDALNRSHIPMEMQGRVFAVRNSCQFFTIPVGYLLGGFLVDAVFEPLLSRQTEGSVLTMLFGTGKGSGAACLFALLWLLGVVVCGIFRADRHIWRLERGQDKR